jgi:hypothetical protein
MMIDFESHRATKGYRFSKNGKRFVALGRLVAVRPFETRMGPHLFGAFARIKSKEALKCFVTAYGRVSGTPNEVPYAMAWARWFRLVIRLKSAGKYESLRKALNDPRNDPFFCEIVTPFGGDGQIKFAFRPVSLLEGMRFQLAEAVANVGDIENCLECGVFFMTGTGDGPRRGAKFCSSAHQRRFNSLKRSRQSGRRDNQTAAGRT